MKLIAHSRRWSNVAASPDVTSGERPSRQRSDRPCAGLRWPRTANRVLALAERACRAASGPRSQRAPTTIRPAALDPLTTPRVVTFSHSRRSRALGYRATRTPADGRALRLVSCWSESGRNARDSKPGGQGHSDAKSYGSRNPAQVVVHPTRCGSKHEP